MEDAERGGGAFDPRRATRGAAARTLVVVLLVALGTFASGRFVLRASDLHLPACSEPYDAAIYPWNFFWVRAAPLADDGSFLFTRRFYHPEGEGLALYTPTYVYGLLSLPFQWCSSRPESLNVAVAFLLWASSVATALLAYALARRLALGRAAALLFATLVTIASGRLMNAARLNLFCTEFLLLHLLCGVELLRRGGWKRALAWGASACALLLQSQPLFFQAALASALFLVGALFRAEVRARVRSDWRALALGAATFLLLAAPFLFEMASELRRFAQSAVLTPTLSLDASGLLVPSVGDRFGELWREIVGAIVPGFTLRASSFFESGGPFGTVSHFLGLGWIALILAACWRAPRGRALRPLLFALAAFSLALGPRMHWRTRPLAIPTLYQLLSWLPPARLEKSPERLVLLVQLALALLAGRGVDALARRRDGERSTAGAIVAALLAALALAEQGETLPLRSIEPRYRIPDEISELARAPGRFAVLDLPYDSSGHLAHRVNALAMACGAFHERPIFFGLYPRASRRNERRLASTTLFREIHRLEALAREKGGSPPPDDPATIAAARQDLAELEVGAVLLHDLADAPDFARREVELLRGFVRSLAPKGELLLTPGPGYALTLFRF